MLRKIGTIFFAACLTAALLLPVSAAEGKSNLLLTLDKTEVAAGDTFTVTLRNNEMDVISFAGGIRFDKDALTCEKIVGTRGGEPSNKCWMQSEEEWISALAFSTLEDSARAGTVGFAFANANEAHYQEGTLFVATFRAKKSGATSIAVYETADGPDTFNSNESATYDVTVTGDTPADPADPTSSDDPADPTASATASPAPTADPVAKGSPMKTVLLIAVPVLIAAAAVVVIVLAKKKKQ